MTDDREQARAHLAAVAEKYRRARAAMNDLTPEVDEAIVRARRAGVPASEVTELSPFSYATTRDKLRSAGIGPSKRGPAGS